MPALDQLVPNPVITRKGWKQPYDIISVAPTLLIAAWFSLHMEIIPDCTVQIVKTYHRSPGPILQLSL